MTLIRTAAIAMAASAIAIFAAIGPARAADPELTFLAANGSLGITANIYYPETVSGKVVTTSEDVYIGGYEFNIGASKTTYYGFCTDLWDNIWSDESWSTKVLETYKNLSTMNMYDKSVNITPLEASEISWIGSKTNDITGVFSPLNVTDGNAFAQLAIWDIETGSSVTYNSITKLYAWTGDFYTDSSVGQGDLADIYTIEQDALNAADPGGKFANGKYFDSLWYQAVNGSEPAGDGRPQDIMIGSAPEPAQLTILLFTGLALAGLVLRARKPQTTFA